MAIHLFWQVFAHGGMRDFCKLRSILIILINACKLLG